MPNFLIPVCRLTIDASRSELRWADGVHLDERSALIVVQSIDRAISCCSKPALTALIKTDLFEGL